MVLDAVGNVLFLSALGVAVGSAAGLVCAPLLLSTRVRSLGRRLGPTPSLPSNYVALTALLGIPVVLSYGLGVDLLTMGGGPVPADARETVRSALRSGYGLLLYVAALGRLGVDEEAANDFDPVDALVLLAFAVAYATVAVGVLVVL